MPSSTKQIIAPVVELPAVAVYAGDFSAPHRAAVFTRSVRGRSGADVTVRGGSAPAVIRKESCGSPYLALEPFTTILFPAVSEYLHASDVASTRTACKAVRQATRNLKGEVVFPHVTEGIKNLPEGAIDLDAVQSMTTSRIESSDSIEITAVSELSNCRTIWWEVNDVENTTKGGYIESARFSVQGIDGLYFRFYPLGKDLSRDGFCSLYIGSDGTSRDVSLRLRICSDSHILTQRLSADYVDGFVNFSDMSGVNLSAGVRVGVEVICGPLDNDLEEMSLRVTPLTSTWTIPRMTEGYVKQFQAGDRLSSDVFTVDGLGEDACFVLYPKGDTVDAISKVGDFVNVGLFGSSNKDVTFRMTAGGVSKVLTACAERYQSKTTGQTKSCGEFFDACFAPLSEILDSEKDELKLSLEVLDTCTKHNMVAANGAIVWTMTDLENLVHQLETSDMVHSRYFAIRGVEDGFFSLSMGFNADGTLKFGLTKISQGTEKSSLNNIRMRVMTQDAAEQQVLRCHFNGVRDSHTTSFSLKNRCLSSLRIELTLAK